MSRGKLLKLLAIDDEVSPSLRTDLIEVVTVPDGEGGNSDRMSNWLQHVYLLGTYETPITFDLLRIDIRFHEDRHAPSYGDGGANPMGLLHALTFAARQDPLRSPFVWGYHSGDPESVKDDPVAIIVFSLLSALERRGEAGDIQVGGQKWMWNKSGVHDIHPEGAAKHFSKAIAELPTGGGETIWKEMVERYRNKFVDYVDDERIFVDPDQVGLLLRAAERGLVEDRRSLAIAELAFTGRPPDVWSRQVLLQSLFADQLVDREDLWPEDTVLEKLVDFLKMLQELVLGGDTDEWYPRVESLMKTLDPQSRVLNNIPLKLRRRVGALGILCWWLERKSNKHTYSTKELLAAFGYEDTHRGPLTKCIASLGYISLDEFFKYLDSTRAKLPPLFSSIGLRWWVARCGMDASKAPHCIRKSTRH